MSVKIRCENCGKVWGPIRNLPFRCSCGEWSHKCNYFVGPGDVLAWALKKIGVGQTKQCGCESRQELMNRVWVFFRGRFYKVRRSIGL